VNLAPGVVCYNVVCSKLYSSPDMLPTVLDDDKMNIDDESIYKLLENFSNQDNNHQSMKICVTSPQLMTPVTGELLQPSVASACRSLCCCDYSVAQSLTQVVKLQIHVCCSCVSLLVIETVITVQYNRVPTYLVKVDEFCW